MLFMRTVRKIQAKYIDALLHEGKQLFVSITGGAYSSNDLGFVQQHRV
jgi:hypothetical protein